MYTEHFPPPSRGMCLLNNCHLTSLGKLLLILWRRAMKRTRLSPTARCCYFGLKSNEFRPPYRIFNERPSVLLAGPTTNRDSDRSETTTTSLIYGMSSLESPSNTCIHHTCTPSGDCLLRSRYTWSRAPRV